MMCQCKNEDNKIAIKNYEVCVNRSNNTCDLVYATGKLKFHGEDYNLKFNTL